MKTNYDLTRLRQPLLLPLASQTMPELEKTLHQITTHDPFIPAFQHKGHENQLGLDCPLLLRYFPIPACTGPHLAYPNRTVRMLETGGGGHKCMT